MIVCKGQAELAKMREANVIVASVLAHLGTLIEPGVRTRDLDLIAEQMIREAGGIPAFKGYRGYPATLCASVNEQIVHGIPNSHPLREGDILSLDVGVCWDGFYGDAAWTFPVGEISEPLQKLLEVTRESLLRGIARIRAGNRISDISASIQQHVEANGFAVVRDFVGHGIGRSLHEEPQVPNFGRPGRGPLLTEGMVLAIEPMVNAKSPEARILADQWTAVTADGGCSAHFEHSVAVTKNGPWILSSLEEMSSENGSGGAEQ
jgi:methionyl aminopeptidase